MGIFAASLSKISEKTYSCLSPGLCGTRQPEGELGAEPHTEPCQCERKLEQSPFQQCHCRQEHFQQNPLKGKRLNNT